MEIGLRPKLEIWDNRVPFILVPVTICLASNLAWSSRVGESSLKIQWNKLAAKNLIFSVTGWIFRARRRSEWWLLLGIPKTDFKVFVAAHESLLKPLAEIANDSIPYNRLGTPMVFHICDLTDAWSPGYDIPADDKLYIALRQADILFVMWRSGFLSAEKVTPRISTSLLMLMVWLFRCQTGGVLVSGFTRTMHLVFFVLKENHLVVYTIIL